MNNPYQAPAADLDTATVEAGDAPVRMWPRIAAHLIDTLVMLPVIAFTFWASSLTRYFYAWWIVPSILIALFYSIYLVYRFGGTPGKLLLKLRVRMADGSPLTAKAAVLRASVMTALSVLSTAALAVAAIAMDDASYLAAGFLERTEALGATAPAWQTPVDVLMQIWIWGSLITILVNQRRRAPHDFIAGTAVVSLQRAA